MAFGLKLLRLASCSAAWANCVALVLSTKHAAEISPVSTQHVQQVFAPSELW
jgi:hypothetical protein